jgi:hypothetical protein
MSKKSIIKNQNISNTYPVFELKRHNNIIIDNFILDTSLNLKHQNKFLSYDPSNNIINLYTHDDDSGNQKWIIEKTTEDTYFIKSQSTNKYLGSVDKNSVTLFDETNKNTTWEIIKMKNNIFRLDIVSNVIIYVLCYSEEKYKLALDIYKDYKWAKPIIMKYQDFSYENAFWKQLLEIKDEWINCDMVGTISWKAYKKVNINTINNIIMNNKYVGNNYVHFFNTDKPVLQSNTWRMHPFFKEIWTFLLKKFKINDFIDSRCNYWMCTPEKMVGFINWYINILPTVLEHPSILKNANYKGLRQNELIKLWGKPYYPHLPFILERFHKAYFVNPIFQNTIINENTNN